MCSSDLFPSHDSRQGRCRDRCLVGKGKRVAAWSASSWRDGLVGGVRDPEGEVHLDRIEIDDVGDLAGDS